MNIEEAIEQFKSWIEYEKNNKFKIKEADKLIEIQETILLAYEKEKEKNNRYKELLIKVLSLNSEILEEKEILLDAFSRRKRGVKMNEEEVIKIVNYLTPYDLPYSTDDVYIAIKKLLDLYLKEKEKNKELEEDILFYNKRIIDEQQETIKSYEEYFAEKYNISSRTTVWKEE